MHLFDARWPNKWPCPAHPYTGKASIAPRWFIWRTVSWKRPLPRASLYAAGLDVTAPEPLDPEHTLLNRDNVVVTPHIASATDKGRVRMYSGAIENARQVLAGERPVDCVNPHVYEVLEGRSS